MNNLKVWTWNELAEQMQGFWSVGYEIPDGILSDSKYECKTRKNFCDSLNSFIEPFRIAQPLVWKELYAMNEFLLVQNRKYPILLDIVGLKDDWKLFIEPFSSSDSDDYWDYQFAHMPEFLRAYYINFNGMRASKFNPMSPGNLPANSTKWQRITDYLVEENVPRKKIADIRSKFKNIDNLFIFLKTDWKDLLFLDMEVPSKKIYAVPEGDFEYYFELESPAQFFDRLCSSVIRGDKHLPNVRDFKR